jgi:stalled ribosome alternative rescue factor ArfA
MSRPSAVAKDLRTPKYRLRIVKAKKGKGSYSRKGERVGQ